MNNEPDLNLLDKVGLLSDDVVKPDKERVLQYKDFLKEITEKVKFLSGRYSQHKWFTQQGDEVEFLRTSGGGWQKGRLRFRLEFVPDDPAAFEKPKLPASDSPLDDLRQNLNLDR